MNTKPYWRVEWHECGWSSRWLVVRGYGASYQVLNDGYNKESDALIAAGAI